MIFVYLVFAFLILYAVNRLTDSLCVQKEIPEDRQHRVFRTINVLVTILLISSYVEVLFA